MNCPNCGAGPFILQPGDALPEPTSADVEIARVNAAHEERMALIARGIDPDRPGKTLPGNDSTVELVTLETDAAVEIATEEASAEVAAAEAVGDAMVAAADVVASALESTAEIVAGDGEDGDALPDEVEIVTTDEETEETAGSGSLASRWFK